MNRFEKVAYGGDDEYGEYDRWSDGGPAWGLNKQKMIDMTRLFATEAARRKAQLQFHSDRYGADMYSPEEAVKRISAVANDKDLDDVENLPNYYNLQYPLKPRSGILETLRLKSPGPIDDWGPEGHPMEAVNRALMGMRSRSGSLKKAAAFGAMMGKRAAYATPSNFSAKPAYNPDVLNGPNPVPDDPTQGFARFAPINNPPAAGTFPGNSGPSMGARDPMSGAPRAQGTLQQWMTPPKGKEPLSFEQNNKMWNQGNEVAPQFSGTRPIKYNSSEEATAAARRGDIAAGTTPEQRLAAMTPEQRQARLDQDTQARRAERDRKSAENEAYQKWYASTPSAWNHSLQPDHNAMIMLGTAGTMGMGVGAGGAIGGGSHLGGPGADAWALGKSFLPQAERTWGQYAGGIGKNLLSYEPTGVSKALATGFAEGGARNMLVPAAVAFGGSKLKSMIRNGPGGTPYNAATDPYTSYAAGKSQATPGTSMAGEPEATPGTRTVGEPQAAPGTNTVGEPQARPMTGNIPNVPRG